MSLIDGVRLRLPLEDRREDSLELLPDGNMGLLFRITSGSLTSTHSRQGDLYAVGTRRRALCKNGSGPPLALFMRFSPGTASSLLGIPANELTDRIVPLAELWGSQGTYLLDQLLTADCVDEMLALVQASVHGRFNDECESTAARLTRHAVRLITQSTAPVRIRDLAAALCVTPRHLGRIFMATVGMGPKHFARIARFQRALRLAASAHSWTAVALEAGYFDQAHMIHDFRALAGKSPQKFGRGLRVRQAEGSAIPLVGNRMSNPNQKPRRQRGV